MPNTISFYSSPHPVFAESTSRAEISGDSVRLELVLAPEDAARSSLQCTSRPTHNPTASGSNEEIQNHALPSGTIRSNPGRKLPEDDYQEEGEET